MTDLELEIANYRREIKSNPQKVESYQLLGEALVKKGELEGAIASYEKTLQLQPNLWGVYQKLADLYRQQGKLSTAAATLEEAIELNPNFSWFYHKLGEIFIELQRWEEAATHLRRAVELNPSFPWSYNKLGKALIELSKWDEAAIAFQQAIQLKPNVYFLYEQLGTALIKLKKFDEALVVYQAALKIKPDSYLAENRLGEVLVRLKKWDEAIAAYNRAIKIKPDRNWARQNLGQVLVKLEKWDEAIAEYRKAIKIKPDFYKSYNSLGTVLRIKGEWEEAIASYIKAIKLKPDVPELYEELRGINTFKLFPLNEDRLDKLAKCYREAIAAKPDFAEHYINLGDILTERGKIHRAINCYQKASYQKLLKSRPELVDKDDFIPKFGKPNFIIIGTVKGGTTSLYNYLVLHPSILPAIQKEVNFFNRKHIFQKGINWYLAHFPHISKDRDLIAGEASPNYMYSPGAAQRIFQCLPEIKLIAILRNPIDRAISHYYMAARLGLEKRSLEEALAAEVEIIKKIPQQGFEAVSFLQKPAGYLRCGLYVYFLKEWMNVFPREQVLVLKSEEMYEEPVATMKKAFDFLGVPNYELPEYKNYFDGSYSRPKKEEIRGSLSALLQPHNQRLEDYLEMKFDWK